MAITYHASRRIQGVEVDRTTPSQPFVSNFLSYNLPRGMAVDSSDNFYYSSTDARTVKELNSDGVLQMTIGGGWGTGDYQFGDPRGVAIDSTGRVIVSDHTNQRIQIFNSSGVYQNTIGVTGQTGSGNGNFTYPEQVAVDSSDNIYVADRNNNRIQKFNSSGTYQMTVTGSFTSPQGVAINSSGDIYVGDTNNDRVQIFNSSGVLQSSIGSLGSPEYISIDSNDNLYVAQRSNHCIRKYNSSNVLQYTLGIYNSSGDTDYSFSSPRGVVSTQAGDYVYVADSGNDKVKKYQIIDTPLANVQVGSRFEETDTRKMYHRDDVDFKEEGTLPVNYRSASWYEQLSGETP